MSRRTERSYQSKFQSRITAPGRRDPAQNGAGEGGVFTVRQELDAIVDPAPVQMMTQVAVRGATEAVAIGGY
jgi:hypothetical protein